MFADYTVVCSEKECREVEVVDNNTSYKVSVLPVGRCEVVLGEKMEEVKSLNLWGTVQCKHREMEGEIREGCGRQVCHRII